MIQTNGVVPADRGRLRKTIRKKVVEILKGNISEIGDNVFPNASVPPWHKELPIILVYTEKEGANKYAQAPKELERELDIRIEIIATGPEVNKELVTPGVNKSLEDILDDIAEKVENLLDVDDSLQDTVSESSLTNTELEYDAVGGSPIGSCRLTYTATYYTMSPRNTDGQPNTDKDFTSNKVEFNIGDDENTRESEDTVIQPT